MGGGAACCKSVKRFAGVEVKLNPQARQNFAVGATGLPQFGQARSSALPQFSQNFDSGGLSYAQFEHFISHTSDESEFDLMRASLAERRAGCQTGRCSFFVQHAGKRKRGKTKHAEKICAGQSRRPAKSKTIHARAARLAEKKLSRAFITPAKLFYARCQRARAVQIAERSRL
jgi:hypothetical protein